MLGGILLAAFPRVRSAILSLLCAAENSSEAFNRDTREGATAAPPGVGELPRSEPSSWLDVIPGGGVSAAPLLEYLSGVTISQLLQIIRAVPWLTRDSPFSADEISGLVTSVEAALNSLECILTMDAAAISSATSACLTLVSALESKKSGSVRTQTAVDVFALPAKHQHVWGLVRKVDLSLISASITACELLGHGCEVTTGSTLRLLVTSGLSGPVQDVEGRLIVEAGVVELSEAECTIGWDTKILPNAEKYMHGVVWRRDRITVSKDPLVKYGKHQGSIVVLHSEYKTRLGSPQPATVDFGIREGLTAAFPVESRSAIVPFGGREAAATTEAKTEEVGGEQALDTAQARVLVPATNTFAVLPVDQLKPGDICAIRSGEIVPADVMLLWSTAPTETAISYVNLDASDTLRLRKVSTEVSSLIQTCVAPPKAAASAEASAVGPAEATMDAFSTEDLVHGIPCPVCTYRNDAFAVTCDVCGTVVPSAANGVAADGSSGSSVPSTSASVFTLMGKGAEHQPVVASLAKAVRVAASPARGDGRRKAWVASTDPSAPWVKLGWKQYMPAGTKLVFTDEVIAIVVGVGGDCYRTKLGGSSYTAIRKRRRVVVEAAEKAWKPIDKELKTLPPWAPVGVDPLQYEAKTGIRWDDHFTDVPDNGNCLISAFHMGLSTLVELYPDARLPGDEALPGNPDDLRTQAMKRLEADPAYRSSLSNMLRLWLQLDASVLMSQVEDVFTLPPDFQTKIFTLNQQFAKQGTMDIPDDAVAGLLTEYIEVLAKPYDLNGKATYVPLGEPELDGLARLYSVHLQTVKADAVKVKGGGSGAGGDAPVIDPRTLRPDVIHDHLRGGVESTAEAVVSKRIVRIVNVSTNHYQVHLPRKS